VLYLHTKMYVLSKQFSKFKTAFKMAVIDTHKSQHI